MALKTVGVVQARTQSTRLPGKVLLTVAGRPLLELMLTRLRHAQQLDELVVATTPAEADRPIVELAARLGVRCVTGHPTDLISRHVLAAQATQADAVVKIPSDCPLVDPRIVDDVVAAFRSSNSSFDYVSNLHPPTWPDGNDVEVVAREALEIAFHEADRPHEREHATPFVWDQPERFRIRNVIWGDGRDLSLTHRLTVDYREDYEVIAAICNALPPDAGAFPIVDDIVQFLDENPVIREHNARHRNTGWPADHIQVMRSRTRGLALAANEQRDRQP